jgi:hypothetical protein
MLPQLVCKVIVRGPRFKIFSGGAIRVGLAAAALVDLQRTFSVLTESDFSATVFGFLVFAKA